MPGDWLRIGLIAIAPGCTLMVAGGLLGLWMIDPGRSVRYAT